MDFIHLQQEAIHLPDSSGYAGITFFSTGVDLPLVAAISRHDGSPVPPLPLAGRGSSDWRSLA